MDLCVLLADRISQFRRRLLNLASFLLLTADACTRMYFLTHARSMSWSVQATLFFSFPPASYVFTARGNKNHQTKTEVEEEEKSRNLVCHADGFPDYEKKYLDTGRGKKTKRFFFFSFDENF